MNVVLLVLGCLAVAAFIWVALGGEFKRRARWFEEAHAALGPGFTPFEHVPSTDRKATRGKLDGADVTFAADVTTTEARLEVPPRKDVEQGRVFDFIVRDSDGAAETGRESVKVGWDDEHGTLVFRTYADRGDAAKTVKELVDEARSFQQRLPSLLEERAKAKKEAASKTFGELTAANGRHQHLGVALALAPEEWELGAAREQGCEWERVPPEHGEALPAELRLYAVATDPALAAEEARLGLLERFAAAFVERQPDGSFDGPAPEPHAKSAPALGAAPCATVALDHLREVVVREEETEPRPYRVVFQGVFQPWAVAVFELVAPRDEAEATMKKILETANFEKPGEKR